MSLRSVQEHKREVAEEELKATLKAEGVDVEEEHPDVFLPDGTKMTKASKDDKETQDHWHV